MKLGSTLNVALITAIALLLEGRSVEAFGGSSVPQSSCSDGNECSLGVCVQRTSSFCQKLSEYKFKKKDLGKIRQRLLGLAYDMQI